MNRVMQLFQSPILRKLSSADLSDGSLEDLTGKPVFIWPDLELHQCKKPNPHGFCWKQLLAIA